MTDIAGKTVLVTGAASGIGKACALAFARAGARAVAACDIDSEGLRDTVTELGRLGCDTSAHRMDVTDAASVEGAVSDAIRQFGHIDILLNSAGVAIMGTMEALTADDWRRVLDVNLWGTINVDRAAYSHMVERRSGHIVNVASANGIYAPMPFIAPYTTSKFGVVGLSEALMVEGRSHGVMVTCACPGNVKTPIYQNSVFKGFSEDARVLTKVNHLVAEKPEKTAAQILAGVKKDKFIVVTTPVAKVSVFMRTHMQRAWFAYTRAFTLVIEKLAGRYKVS